MSISLTTDALRAIQTDWLSGRLSASLNGMLTCVLAVGVDLSAEELNTWMASVEFLPSGATLARLEAHVSNDQIVAGAGPADVVGIDCALGWPVAFVDFVNEHMRGDVAPREGTPIDWRRHLAYRATDRSVIAETGLRPLSVAADRIAHAAMRCAALLAELQLDGIEVDRSGMTGKVVEVYPAASLAQWGLTHRGYKRAANAAPLDDLVSALQLSAPWLDLGEYESACRTNDDAFDAVIAALSAAASARGLTTPPTGSAMELARREGWIVVPHAGSVSQLIKVAM
jgi:predicted nuclease with RNAse H fold